jgi:hypothetical protein
VFIGIHNEKIVQEKFAEKDRRTNDNRPKKTEKPFIETIIISEK